MHLNANFDFNYDYDLVIVGGGLVGACLALGLAQANQTLTILVLEQKVLNDADDAEVDWVENSEQAYDFSQKTLAINQGTKLFLDDLGIWPESMNSVDFLTPIKTVHVSMQNAFGQFHFMTPKNEEALGYIIQIKLLEKFLADKIIKLTLIKNNITWVQPMSEVSLKIIPSGWQVTYFDVNQHKEQTIKAKCVVGSDGPNSVIKKSVGISDKIFDYGHVATIANVKLNQINQKYHDNIAYERFTQEGGAVALLPYGIDSMTLIFTSSVRQSKMIQNLSDAELLLKLSDIMGGRFNFNQISQRIQVPLTMKIATHQIARRAILIGNAAHLLHPIAAQGFNLSIQDIAYLIELCANHVNDLNDIGSSNLLYEYDRQRQSLQNQFIQATNNIATYYASQTLPSWLKGMSLLLFNHLPVQSYLTAKSMGKKIKISERVN